jgi:4-carboxymuconolactone decarboxylase
MTPRIPPVDFNSLDQETRSLLDSLSGVRREEVDHLNVFTTLAQHPKLLKRWLVFANHVLAKSELPARDRELAILRTGWRCAAPYEWGQHVAIARGVGITDDEVARVAAGPDAPGWPTDDAALLRAVDELHDDGTIRDATWATLADRYDTHQLMDLVFAIGQYHLVSFALNAFRVERDDGVSGVPFPDRA